jgi:hypothetical protein
LKHPTLVEVEETVESSTWFTVNNNVFSALWTRRIPCMSLVTSNNENKTYDPKLYKNVCASVGSDYNKRTADFREIFVSTPKLLQVFP